MIDTLNISIKSHRHLTVESLKSINKLPEVISKYTRLNGDSISIILKPSFQYKNTTSNLSETIELVKSIEDNFNTKAKLLRFDIAYDTNDTLKDNKNIFNLFLGCLNYIRNSSRSSIGHFKIGLSNKNFKISNNKLETTIYDSQDKIKRNAATRIENRVKRVSSLPFEKAIINDISKYITELNNITKNIPYFEKSHVIFLIKEWNENKKELGYCIDKFINNIDLSGLILTRNILSELLPKIGYTGKTESFIKNYRRRSPQGLNFVSKNDLNKLITQLKKNAKSIY